MRYYEARRRRQRLIAIVAVGVSTFTFFAGLQLWKRANAATGADANRIMATRVLRLGQALERHATRQDRLPGQMAYPLTVAFPAFVRSLPEGEKLLRSPWGEPSQAKPVHAGGATGLPTATQHLRGAEPPTLRVPLGPGTPPVAGGYSALTYGALVYDHDPVSDTFVLYGIGEAEGKAVIVAETDSDL